MEHQCLPLPAVLDAPSKQLDRLVRDATCPDIAFRTDTVTKFLDDLKEVEDQLTSPNTVENPLAATKDQLLTSDIRVEKRLGTGGTAAVFLVQSENRTCVLKLALKPEYNERIRSEFEILQGLRDDKIAEPENSPDRGRLASIVSAVIPDMEKDLRCRALPVLLTCPGLLARYNQLGMIERLRDNPGSNTRWLLVASSARERKPMIDTRTVPVFSSAQWQALTPSWIESNA